MAYVKTIWENSPSESTPINASNLNKMENGIYNNSVNIDNINNNLDTITTYSTDEQVIGTWIDGKPIYRKVLKYTTQASEYDISDLHIETLIKNDYFQELNITATGYYYLRSTFYSNSSDYFFAFFRSDKMQVRATTPSNEFVSYYFILEYTKTTD